METVLLSAALTSQVTDWLNSYGAILFYLIVWGLVFAGTGLLIGAFIPFITGDSLIFASGLLAATSDSINIWVLTIGIGLAAFVGDQTGADLDHDAPRMAQHRLVQTGQQTARCGHCRALVFDGHAQDC